MLFWLKKFISFWLMPLPFCLTAMVAGLLLLLVFKRARLGRWLLVVGVGILMLLSNPLLSKRLIRALETRYAAIPELVVGAPLPPALAACRYVVVLGGGNGNTPGLSANNLLSTSAASRLFEAVRILRVQTEAKMIVSGPGDGRRETHAVVLARAAQAYGIEPGRILYIEQARDTEEESRAVQRLAQGGRVALVTSAWHMPRSVALFRSAGLDPLPCPADFRGHSDEDIIFDDFLWDVESLTRSTFAIRERIGYLWIWLRGKA